LASFGGIQFIAQPVFCRFCNFAARNDEGMVYENSLANFWIKYFVT